MHSKKSSIICPNTLSHHSNAWALQIYCMMQLLYYHDKEVVLVEHKILCKALGFSFPIQQKKKQLIYDTLEDLYDENFIDKDEYGNYLLDTHSFYQQTEGFETCDPGVFEIMRNNAELFRHYILIKRGLIDGKCTFSLNYFEKIECASRNTITKRNKQLVDMKLIVIYQTPYDPNSKEWGKNIYMLYDKNYSGKEKKESAANLNRSVTQRYNNYKKHPEKFTPLQRKELIKQVKEYNKRNPEKQKDINVFYT